MPTREATSRRKLAADIVRHLMRGNYNDGEILELLDSLVLMDIIVFFGEVGSALISKEDINLDWYTRRFDCEATGNSSYALDADISGNRLAMTTSKRSEDFGEDIESLITDEIKVDVSLKRSGITLHLNLSESLVVINALAVRRAAIRGGAWSTAGKQVEGPLMETLCRLFGVDERQFTRSLADDGSLREVDFYLLPPDGSQAKCEVKLMGSGNPEGADVVIARDSRVFVASTLSDMNKTQLKNLGVLWTELQTENGFIRFQETLRQLDIPHSELPVKSDYTPEIERAVQATFAV